MDPIHSHVQASEPQWLEPPNPTNQDKFLELRIEKLGQQLAAYDALLNDSPGVV